MSVFVFTNVRSKGMRISSQRKKNLWRGSRLTGYAPGTPVLPPIIVFISLVHGIFVAHALLALHRSHMYLSGLIGKRLWTFKSCVNSCFPYNISLSL